MNSSRANSRALSNRETNPGLALALKIGLWCNNSQLEPPNENVTSAGKSSATRRKARL